MGLRLPAVILLSAASISAFPQKSTTPDVTPGPVPPAVQQMPNRFQPPVPGCTDCYYTVPTGKVVGAMGTTNNEGVPPPDPAHTPKPAAIPSTAIAPPSDAPTDLVFSSGNGVWALKAAKPLPLFIGSKVGLYPLSTTTRTLASACNLTTVDYTTTAGIITTLSIPLSLWDVTTGTKLADLPTNWDSWQTVHYPAVDVGKKLPAGHKLQVRLTQPPNSALPVNFQLTIKVSAHCPTDAKPTAPAAPKTGQK